jgi:antitoxin component YwqK of YwqJK toxin-antitoxin module
MENYNKHAVVRQINGNIEYEDGLLNRFCVANKNIDGHIYFEEYSLNGKYHRLDGPAFIEYYKSGNIYMEQYYLNGEFHCVNGPAIVCYKENGRFSSRKYFLFGKLIEKEDFYTPGFIDSFILENS